MSDRACALIPDIASDKEFNKFFQLSTGMTLVDRLMATWFMTPISKSSKAYGWLKKGLANETNIVKKLVKPYQCLSGVRS